MNNDRWIIWFMTVPLATMIYAGFSGWEPPQTMVAGITYGISVAGYLIWSDSE